MASNDLPYLNGAPAQPTIDFWQAGNAPVSTPGTDTTGLTIGTSDNSSATSLGTVPGYTEDNMGKAP